MSSGLLLIALDSCDPRLVLDWAATGALPTFAKLLGSARRREVINAPGFFGGTVWPSFATGLSPAGHGRFCAVQARRGEYESRPFHSTDIAGRQFWEVCSDAGRRVCVIDVPMSRPSPRLNGIQVVDFLTHDGFFHPPVTSPPELYAEIAAGFGGGRRDTCDTQWTALESADRVAAFTEHLVRRANVKGRLCEHYLRREEWDLFIATFAEGHCAGHQGWHVHDPTHPRHRREVAAAAGDPLLAVYQAIDEQIARLLAAAPGSPQVMLWLTHGMGTAINDYSVVTDEILCRLDSATGRSASRAYRSMKGGWYRLPDRLRRLPGANAMKRVLLPRLRRSMLVPQRRHRRFFAVPSDTSTGAVRVNCVGREHAGLVPPGGELRELIEGIARDLADIVDAETGQPAVSATHVPRDLYAGPHLDALPDLLIDWNHDNQSTALKSPRIGTLPIPRTTGRSGEHRRNGLLLVCGSNGAAIESPIPIEDVAGLICRQIGIDFRGDAGSG